MVEDVVVLQVIKTMGELIRHFICLLRQPPHLALFTFSSFCLANNSRVTRPLKDDGKKNGLTYETLENPRFWIKGKIVISIEKLKCF